MESVTIVMRCQEHEPVAAYPADQYELVEKLFEDQDDIAIYTYDLSDAKADLEERQ